ncbi:DUF805 domain-containing protein [Pseudoduganella buxea]|nr:DUF805 domain-containing protein [Pseudoduganella buxea]GGC16569.1 hypothetical protein GCM10011572_42370 [Pseudoduganella buxea]
MPHTLPFMHVPQAWPPRIGRLRFGLSMVATGVAVMAAMLLAMHLPSLAMTGTTVIMGVAWAATIAAMGLAGIGRLKDIGWPLWLAAGLFLPFVGLALFGCLLFVPGTPGASRHGDAPEPRIERAWARRLGTAIFASLALALAFDVLR